MSQRFIRPILINLAILIIIFCAFIFIDVSAAGNNIVRRPEDRTASTNVSPITDYRETPVYDWAPSHYHDLNLVNEQTNSLLIEISPGETRSIAFFSRQVAYYRFEIASFIIRGVDPDRCYVTIQKDQKILPAYKGPQKLHFTRRNGEATASWFHDWNTPVALYSAILWVDNKAVARTKFSYIKRDPVKFNRSYALLNLEFPIHDRIIQTPSNADVDFNQGLKTWMDYGEMDGFLMLGGQTSGHDRINPQYPWASPHLDNVERIGKDIHDHGKLFGAYIMCFYTPEKGWEKGGYRPALGVGIDSQGRLVPKSAKFTSFTDPKRFNDIVKLARHFNQLPYVDMIGFDFIRFGEKVGYENAEEFALDMNIPLPASWNRFTLDQKVVWLGQKMKNKTVGEQWRLWKAHKTADLVYRVIRTAGITKPTWVFTLGWDHGRDHGQDPRFFQDAGVLADMVMLYEASPRMFQTMQKQWVNYLSGEHINYIPGNQIDSVVNESSVDRNPVEEYFYRLTQGADYAPYLSRGVFIHDIHRAFFSKRRKGYSYREWLMAGMASVSYQRFRNREIPFYLEFPQKTFYYHKDQQTITIPYTVHILPEQLQKLQNRQIVLESPHSDYSKKLDINGRTNVTLYIRVNPIEKGSQYMALKAKLEGHPSYFAFRYFNFQKKSD